MAVTTALTDSTFRSGSTGTTSSVASIGFGTAFAGRVITIAFVMNGGGKPLSATIGGIAASVAGDWVNVGVGWASAVVPTGTSGTLAITTAATDQAFTYCAIAVTGARDANPVDAILSTTGSGTIDVISGGAVVAICAANASGAWTGATSLLAWASGTNVAVASFDNSGASVTGRTISYSGASASGMTAVAFVPTGTPAMAVFADNNGITGGAGTISTITLTTYGGIEYAGRVVVLPIFTSGLSAITAVTIGGITADISVTGSYVCLASAVVPTDGNKAVVVTMAASDTPIALGTIIVYGATSATPVKSSTSSSNPFTIDVPGSGSLVTLAGFPSSSFTWSGVTALGVPISAAVFWSPAHFDNAGGDITAYSVGSTPTPSVGYLAAVYLGTVIAPQDITSTGAVTVLAPTVVGAGALDSIASGAVTVPAPTAAGVATETPIWSFVGVSNAAINASGNYTLTEPAGTAQNDLLVVDFAIRSTVIYTNAAWTFPQSDAGGNTTNAATTSDTSFQTGYVIRGASAPTLVFSRAAGSRALGSIRAYRSNSPGRPRFDTSGKFAQTTAATGITFTGGITTAEADELITTGVYLARGAATNNASAMVGVTTVTGTSGALDTTTAPQRNTWTERVDRGDTTNPTVGLACYDVVKSVLGSTGNLSATAASSALNGMTAMAFKHPAALTAANGTVALTGVAATLTKTTAGGATNPVQKNGGTVSQNVSIVTSLPSATTAGNTILIFANGAGTITTPSGFTSRSPQVNSQGCYLFEKLVASGNSTDTPTLTMSGAFNATWQIAEYKNITAYDTSSGNGGGGFGTGFYSTPTITPASGNKRIVAFVVADRTAGSFAAGDPQSWTNNFVGQQSNEQVGTSVPTGNDWLVGGWADLLVATAGAGYNTSASIGASTSTLLPASIIAAYTTTDIPPVAPGPHFRSISSTGYASHTNTVVTAPAGIVDGDILILGLAVGAATPPASTLPSGFTLIDAQTVTQSGGGFSVEQKIAWKRAASESGSYTITHATASSNAFIAVYSNCIATGSPIDAYSKNGATSVAGSFGTALSITTTAANTMVLLIDHDWAAAGTQSPQSAAFLERYENLEWLGDAVYASAGATGNINVGPLTAPYQAWQVGLKPAAAGGTAYTLTATTGAFTLAGTTTGLRAARKLPLTVGAITLAGTATIFKVTVPVVTGTYALAGTATGLKLGHKLVAVTGAYTLAGTATGLKLGHKLVATAGAYTLTGTATNFKIGHALTAAAGAYTLTGTATGFRITRALTAGTGAYTLTGYAASLSKSTSYSMLASKGSYALTGYDVELVYTVSAPVNVELLPPFLANENVFGVGLGDTFFPPTVILGEVLLPSLYTDPDNFFTPVVTTGATTLTASRYDDPDTFFNHVVASGEFLLAPPFYVDPDNFFAPVVAVSAIALTPALYTDPDNFFAPAVTVGTVALTPALYTDPDNFFTAAVTSQVTITPARYDDPDGFFTHTAAFVDTIAPNLYTDPDSFFTPVITLSGAAVFPALYTDPDNFFTHVVTSKVTLAPALYTDPDVFYGHVASEVDNVYPPLLTNTNNFYAPTVKQFWPIFPALFVDPDNFFPPFISYDQFVNPGRYNDPDQFYPAIVTLFYGDTEVICVHYEDRRMEAAFERRMMIAPREDRLMYGMALEGTVDSPALVPRENRFMEVLDEDTDMDNMPRRRAC